MARISVKPEVAKQMTDNDLLLLTKDHPQDENCRWGLLGGLSQQFSTPKSCIYVLLVVVAPQAVTAVCCWSTGLQLAALVLLLTGPA